MERTGETDSPAEEGGFELLVPPRTRRASFETTLINVRLFWSGESDSLARGDREFEPPALRQGAYREPVEPEEFGRAINPLPRFGCQEHNTKIWHASWSDRVPQLLGLIGDTENVRPSAR